MPLTIADMMQMEPFANFKLIAGANGIGRTIETVNILDYEYTSEYNPAELPDSFKKNALVLSSLLFAKYQPEQLINVVKKLVDYRTSALAVKSIILKDLPEDVIDYCNRHSFPVFLFSENEGYFENIITFITDEIRQSTDYAHFEEKLSLLSQDNLSGLEVQRIAMELFPELELPYRLTAINPQLTETAFYKKLRHSHKLPKVPVYSFCKTYVTALPAGNPKTYYNEFQAVIDSLYLNEKLCYTGFSNLHDKMDEFHYAFNECFYSCTYAQKQKLPQITFNQLGLSQILYPYRNDYWLSRYCSQILDTIQSYDKKHSNSLMETAVAYVKSGANTIRTAQALHIHKNTVHYRVNKLKGLIPAGDENDFYEQLAVAIRNYLLN